MDEHTKKHQSESDFRPAPALAGTEDRGMKRVLRAIGPEQEAKHHESMKKYPELTLSKGEYVVAVVRRHPIGLVFIWAFVGLLTFLVLTALVWYSANLNFISGLFLLSSPPPSAIDLAPLVFIFLAFIALGCVLITVELKFTEI